MASSLGYYGKDVSTSVQSWMEHDCGVWVVYSADGIVGHAELYDYDKLVIDHPDRYRVVYLGTRDEAELFVENAKVL